MAIMCKGLIMQKMSISTVVFKGDYMQLVSNSI